MGTAQQNNILQSGGQVNSNGPYWTVPLDSSLTGLITLSAQINTSTAGNFLVWYQSGVQYQVTAAKTFVSFGLWAYGSGTVGFNLGTSTATFANDAASVTGAVHYSGAEANTQLQTTTGRVFFPFPFQFAATLYPFVSITGGAANVNFIMIGREY